MINKLDAEDEEVWLAQRWELLTGSGASILMGANPWKDRMTLLKEYLSRESGFVPSAKTWLGSQMEAAIGRATAAALGLSFSPMNQLRWHEGELLGSTTDGYLTENADAEASEVVPCGHKRHWRDFADAVLKQVDSRNFWLEIKNVGQHNLQLWNKKNNPPEYYWWQCQTQMHVLEEDQMGLVALVGGQDLRPHIVKRDQSAIDKLLQEATTFMHQVFEGRNL